MNMEEELRKFLNSFADSLEKNCSNKECCEEEEEDLILNEIGEEYNEFLYWAFGTIPDGSYPRSEMKKRWNKRHENLPVPRVFEITEKVSPNFNSIFLLMDAYPLYLKSKKKVGA